MTHPSPREPTLLDPPAESLSQVVVWATAAFYADLHPVTPLGRMIGGVLMTVGPALAAHALDPPRNAPTGQEAVLGRLDAILEELKRWNAASGAAP